MRSGNRAIVALPVTPARLKALLDPQGAKCSEESRPRRTVDKAT